LHTIAWLECYWRHYGASQQLRVLLVHFAGRPFGVVPLRIHTVRSETAGNEREVTRVVSYVFSDFGPCTGPIGADAALLKQVARDFLATRDDWDKLDLEPHQSAAVVDFTGDWDAYLAAKPKKVRHEMRRSLRRAFDDGHASYLRYRPVAATTCTGSDPRWDLFDLCHQVALASWQARAAGETSAGHPPMNEFLRDAHAAASKLGMIDINLLLVDGDPVAFTYNYCHQGQIHGVQHAYDVAAPSGLGKALLLRQLEDSFARGDRSQHLGANDSRLKAELQTRELFPEPTNPRCAPLAV
jgi:CelD/BcsL family acetyltransferase involved in cellulose biosynthesis